MKVKDIIERLQQYDGDAEVVVPAGDHGYQQIRNMTSQHADVDRKGRLTEHCDGSTWPVIDVVILL